MDETKSSIVAAFSRLVRDKGAQLPSIAEVLAESGVARSTLYRHFDDRTSLLVAAIDDRFQIISTAAVEGKSSPKLVELLEHFWSKRSIVVELLGPPSVNRLARKLGEQINAKHSGLKPADAVRVAHMQLTLLRLWLSGETPGPASDLAKKLARSSYLLITGFAENKDEPAGEFDG